MSRVDLTGGGVDRLRYRPAAQCRWVLSSKRHSIHRRRHARTIRVSELRRGHTYDTCTLSYFVMQHATST